jgi:hypothetical protein
MIEPKPASPSLPSTTKKKSKKKKKKERRETVEYGTDGEEMEDEGVALEEEVTEDYGTEGKEEDGEDEDKKEEDEDVDDEDDEDDAAAREEVRQQRRLALCEHASALLARRRAEAAIAEERLATTTKERRKRGEAGARARVVAAAAADAASARLVEEKRMHNATRDAAEETVAALAGEAGVRARALAAEQRLLTAANLRRDDAADAADTADMRVDTLRNRAAAAAVTAATAVAAAVEAAAAATRSPAAEEAAALADALCELHARNEATTRRMTINAIASSSDLGGGGRVSSSLGLPSQSRRAVDLNAQLSAATDQLITEQSRVEALASEKATFALRLESAANAADQLLRGGGRRAEAEFYDSYRSGGGGVGADSHGRGGAGSNSGGYFDEEVGVFDHRGGGDVSGNGDNGGDGGGGSDGDGDGDDGDDDDDFDNIGPDGRHYKDHAHAPRQVAYQLASAAFGHDRARDVADAWGAIDGMEVSRLLPTTQNHKH